MNLSQIKIRSLTNAHLATFDKLEKIQLRTIQFINNKFQRLKIQQKNPYKASKDKQKPLSIQEKVSQKVFYPANYDQMVNQICKWKEKKKKMQTIQKQKKINLFKENKLKLDKKLALLQKELIKDSKENNCWDSHIIYDGRRRFNIQKSIQNQKNFLKANKIGYQQNIQQSEKDKLLENTSGQLNLLKTQNDRRNQAIDEKQNIQKIKNILHEGLICTLLTKQRQSNARRLSVSKQRINQRNSSVKQLTLKEIKVNNEKRSKIMKLKF